jgi:hypothetical protein
MRFEEKIELIPECGCWIWLAATYPEGYGMIRNSNQVPSRAHRVSWEIYKGEIPENMCVLHRCDTPLCVNPHHLFLGVAKDNVQDMIKKHRKYSPRGELSHFSKLREADVIEIRKSAATPKEISIRFNISGSTVSYIKSNKSWRHL